VLVALGAFVLVNVLVLGIGSPVSGVLVAVLFVVVAFVEWRTR